MPTFGSQRLFHFQRHHFRLPAMGHRRPIDPRDLMGIEHQLLLRQIIEHRHLPVADDHEPLLLHRMEPADEDMSPHPIGKLQMGHRDIRHAGLQVGPSARLHRGRRLPRQMNQGRDIVRGKTPEDVFFAAKLPDIQPVRIDILQLPELASRDESVQGRHRGMIPQHVPDHENASLAGRQLHDLSTISQRQRQGLFDKDVLAR